jgi:hypothetical protein
MPALPRRILTYWQCSGIEVIQSGASLSVLDGNAGSVYGNFNNRAQATGKSVSTHGSLFSRGVGSGRYLVANALMGPPVAPDGGRTQPVRQQRRALCAGRGSTIRHGGGAVFPLTEASSFRIRAEFFNLTNTPQFSNHSTFLGYGDPTLPVPTASASFGRITSTATNPRLIQFAAKYVF